MAEDTVKGYRILGDRPKDRSLSMDYLQQSPKASKLLRELWDRAPKEGANCVGQPEKWTSDELPTDREAQIMCAGCGILELCQQYVDEGRPAFGVWAARVRGRDLQERIESDNGGMEAGPGVP